MTIKNLGKNCPVSMPYNIAEPDKVYGKCHHLLNTFESYGTSHFYQMDQSIFVFMVVWCCFSFLFKFDRISCKQTVESMIRYCSLWRLILVCAIFVCPTKRTLGQDWLILCCLCYSHQLYNFFIKLDNDWSRFNYKNRHGVCHMWDKNRYD